jgi:hypothetical protein
MSTVDRRWSCFGLCRSMPRHQLGALPSCWGRPKRVSPLVVC